MATSMSKNLQQLIKKRAIIRGSFTKISRSIEEIIDDRQNFEEISGKFQLCREKHEALRNLDNEILDMMIEDETTSEAKLTEEQESADDYCSKWYTLESQVNTLHKEEQSSSSSTARSTTKTKGSTPKLKLPELKLVQFDGDLRNWVSFWGQFQKIHDNVTIDNHDKFQYLLSAIPRGTPARSLIDSFPPSADNYSKAVDHLQQRFGREDLLIEVYMRDLLSLVLIQVKSGQETSLSTLYDKLTTQLRALESLGLTNDKYAVMLYPLVESALPDDVLKTWERERSRDSNKSPQGKLLKDLLSFLRQEVESSQRIDLAKSSFSIDGASTSYSTPALPTASCLVAKVDAKETQEKRNSIKKGTCIWCEKESHSSTECEQGLRLSLDERKKYLKKAKACERCLRPGHNNFGRRCKTGGIRCIICLKGSHCAILCPKLSEMQEASEVKNNKTQENSSKSHHENKIQNKSDKVNLTSNLTHSDSTVTLLQTLLVKIDHCGKKFVVRALIDSGAQRSYIKTDLAKELGLPIVGQRRISHVVFGGLKTEQTSHNVYEVSIANLEESFACSLTVIDQAKICGDLPRVYECQLIEKLLQSGVSLTDVGRDIPEVSLLIGADYCGMLLTNQLVQLDNGLTALRTKLGWTVQGVKSSLNTSLCTTNNLHIADLWELEAIGIRDPAETKSEVEMQEEILRKFEQSITINNEQRYEVSLPWKDGHPLLLTNRELAVKRLICTTKRLNTTSNYEAYDKVFQDWVDKGIIEKVHDDDRSGHYLAHHPVIKESSTTTRIRPVFDASSRDRNGNSINSCLEKGVNLLELIPKLLIQFRLNPIGVTADIEKAFLQISLAPNDREYLKFLWWDSKEGEIMTYRHCRVVFGLTCSPFLLGATIKHHLERIPLQLKETANRLLKSFYVDNCIISLEEKDVDKFVSEAKEVMAQGKFNLREWVVAPTKDAPKEVTVSVLGVAWNTKDDVFTANVNMPATVPDKLTRRTLLSVTQRVFDPIGFTAPTTLIPKLLMKDVWSIKGGWDDELPQEISDNFLEWWDQTRYLTTCHLPRRLMPAPTALCNNTSLHVFCDASAKSYASCIFLRSEYEGQVIVQLVLAKARVAPSKQRVTIPRLELLAALIGTRLCTQVTQATQMQGKVYYWTDSAVALTWIKKDAPWAVFVRNRVQEIRANSDIESWRFVPGTINPADLPSRGCNPKSLVESKWWEGPQWLRLQEDKWPKLEQVEDKNAEEELLKTRSHELVTLEIGQFTDELLYFSKYTKMLRMFAWILRFTKVVSKKDHDVGILSSSEVKEAEILLFKIIQHEMKLTTKRDLVVFKDQNGLLRVQSRLLLTDEPESFKWPILLPGKNSIVERLVREKHTTLCHAGVTTLITVLRETYWIIGVRRLAKKIVAYCVPCQRFKSKPCSPPFAPLPANRLNNSAAAFEVCGIDCAGPLMLKSREKAWIVLFTCAVYRAVHCELTLSLSTEAFLMAFRRFIARRGRISVVYTDNGTNFVGAANLFKGLDWNKIQSAPEVRPIKWIFNPPSATWWGGWWERLIRSVKELLRRVLGRAVVSYVELETLLCDCEAVINSRPLTYVTEADLLNPITPNDFLQSIPRNETPDIDLMNAQSLNQRVAYLQKLREDFRQRFRSEYLSQLVQRGKENVKLLEVGAVVLIETPEKRVRWPIGVITELIPGRDGHTRVAKVKTATGQFSRPLQRLYPLEISPAGGC